MDKKRIPWLDTLRVWSIFLVLVCHVCEMYYFNSTGEFSIKSKSDALWLTVVDSACRSAVPLFVFASSFLLFPVSSSTGEFLKKRMLRVFVPFLLWSIIYIVWNGGAWSQLLFNFPMVSGGHMWFVPMLLGLYLLMPLISPWAEKVSKRELFGWLGVWFFTTFFPFIRKASLAVLGEPIYGVTPFLYGECPWNAFGMFQYVSGFFGYVLLGLYFRKFVGELSWKKTLAVALPVFAVGWAIVWSYFYFRIPIGDGYPVTKPYATAVDMETSWEFCSVGVVFTTLGYILILRKLNIGGVIGRFLIRPAGIASYGTYLMHIIPLYWIGGSLRPWLESALGLSKATPFVIFFVAAMTMVLCSVVSYAIHKIPRIGKHIVG